jgi:hypothetical protein
MAMRETQRWRRLTLENSAVMAVMADSRPPMPRPVITLQIDNSTTLSTVVTMNMPTAIVNRQPNIVLRRPMMSATQPNRMEPAAIPKSSMERTTPRPALSMPHSLAIPVDAKLMDRTSKPSRPFSPTVIAIMKIWSRLIGARSIVSRGSVFISAAFLASWNELFTPCHFVFAISSGMQRN